MRVFVRCQGPIAGEGDLLDACLTSTVVSNSRKALIRRTLNAIAPGSHHDQEKKGGIS